MNEYGIVYKKPNTTYKFRSPGVSDHAGYFIIVGEPIPEAFFINSKEMKSFQWISALMTSYSRQLRAGIDARNIIEDMKGTFDPGGSYIIPDGTNREVNSVVHHLGLILEEHMKTIRSKPMPPR